MRGLLFIICGELLGTVRTIGNMNDDSWLMVDISHYQVVNTISSIRITAYFTLSQTELAWI